MNVVPNFGLHQVVFLSHQGTYLYAEVIQISQQRQLCWARPLLLVQTDADPNVELCDEPRPILGSGKKSNRSTTIAQGVIAQDVRQASDLLLPWSLFQIALDEDLLPFLGYLNLGESGVSYSGEQQKVAQQALNRFIRKLCWANPDCF